jgi:prepilin-type N-terminal cleavage/methylation domain-containing protein
MSHPGQRGITLIEIIIAIVLGSAVTTLAYSFYQNMMGNLERQKRVTAIQDGIRTAVDCINRFLIAGGVSGDSLFYDPHRLLPLPIVNGGHRVFDVTADSAVLRVYGNYSGGAATVEDPVVNKGLRQITVSNPGIFRAGGYAYIFAGSAQETARITSIRGNILYVGNDFFAYYPKGTLIYPLERIRIARNGTTLEVHRETAAGAPVFPREFVPTSKPGDSLEFKVRSLDHETGQIGYALTFVGEAPGRTHMKLVRRSEQTVFVRGF